MWYYNKYHGIKENYAVIIDARGLKHPEPLRKLLGHFSTLCSIQDFVDLLVDDEKEVKQVKIYAAMSGSECEAEKQDGHYRVRLKSPCA